MVFRNLVRDSAIYGGADLVTKIIAFLSFPFIAAALSPLAFGALELIATITAVLGLGVNCGLNNAVQRFYWDKDTTQESRPVIVSSGLAVQVFFAAIIVMTGLLVVALVYVEIQKAQLPMTWKAIFAALFLMAFNQWNQYILDVIRLHFQPFYFLIISSISRVAAAFLGVLVVVVFGWGIDGLLSVQAIAVLAALPLAIFFIRKDLTFRIDRAWIRELVSFGYPFIFVGLAYWLFGSMDRWMLAYLSSVEEVGIYSVAFRFAAVALFVSSAFSQAWSPAAIKIKTDNPEGYREIYAHVLLLLLYVMLIVAGGLALFSGEFMGSIMPAAYAGSALPLSILCFGIVLQASLQVTALGISLEKKTVIFARLAWLAAAINLILNWILIPSYGAVGAAWATTVSYLVLTGSYMYFTQRLHPLPVPWRRLSAILFLGIMVGVVALVFNQPALSWGVAGFKLIFAIMCAGLGWLVLPIRRLDFVGKE